jgi:hypothetical protein
MVRATDTSLLWRWRLSSPSLGKQPYRYDPNPHATTPPASAIPLWGGSIRSSSHGYPDLTLTQ